MLGRIFSMNKETVLVAPLSGTIVELSQVPDPVFSQKLAGDGFALIPDEGKLVSPVDGEVILLFPTLHAIGIKSNDGLEILLHIGIDTTKLQAKGFEALVQSGDSVKKGDALIQFDADTIQAAGYPLVTPVIFTNGEVDGESVEQWIGKSVQAGEPLSIRVQQKGSF
jgi:glucose-specific phosphotransferase system IIA component